MSGGGGGGVAGVIITTKGRVQRQVEGRCKGGLCIDLFPSPLVVGNIYRPGVFHHIISFNISFQNDVIPICIPFLLP